jgi:hypothetical protein
MTKEVKAVTRKRPSPLTPEQWAQVQFIFESSGNISKASEDFGISRRAIYKAATKGKWKRRGALSDEARVEAVDAFKEDFRKMAEKVTNRHLGVFSHLQDVVMQILKEIEAIVTFKRAYNDLAREKNYEMLKGAKWVEKRALKSLLDLSREVSAIGILADTFIKATMKGERAILGLTDYKLIESKNTNPIDRMIEVVEQGIAAFQMGVANGTIDPNTGNVIGTV